MHIFKPGTYKFGNKEFTFTDDDLDKLAKNYDPNWFQAPLVIGHPEIKEDTPAYGLVKKVFKDKDGLYAEVEVPEEVAEVLKYYPHRSVGLVKTPKGWYLEHIGLLGAAPPKVKGLKPIQFADLDGERLTFSLEDDKSLLQEIYEKIKRLEKLLFSTKSSGEGARRGVPDPIPLADPNIPWDWDWAKDADAIINKYGWKGLAAVCAYVDRDYETDRKEEGLPAVKAAYHLPYGKIINGELKIVWNGVRAAMAALAGARGGIKLPKDAKEKVYKKLVAAYKRFGKKPPQLNFSEEVDMEELKKLQEELKKLKEENEKLKLQFSELVEKKQKELEQKFIAKSEIEKFVEANKDRIPPAIREDVEKFMETLSDTVKLTFSENGKEEEISQVEFFKKIIEKLPDQRKLFSEYGDGKKDRKPVKLNLDVGDATVDEEMLTLHEKALKFSKEKNVSYEEALEVVMTGGEE